MPTMTCVEDIINNMFYENSVSAILNEKETSFIHSVLLNRIYSHKPLTKKQAKYCLVILKKYKHQLSNLTNMLGYNIDEIIENKIFKYTPEETKVQKNIIVVEEEYILPFHDRFSITFDKAIVLEFKFNQNLITKIKSKIKTYNILPGASFSTFYWVPEDKVWVSRFNKNNIKFVVELLKKFKFDYVDEEILEEYEKIQNSSNTFGIEFNEETKEFTSCRLFPKQEEIFENSSKLYTDPHFYFEMMKNGIDISKPSIQCLQNLLTDVFKDKTLLDPSHLTNLIVNGGYGIFPTTIDATICRKLVTEYINLMNFDRVLFKSTTRFYDDLVTELKIMFKHKKDYVFLDQGQPQDHILKSTFDYGVIFGMNQRYHLTQFNKMSRNVFYYGNFKVNDRQELIRYHSQIKA